MNIYINVDLSTWEFLTFEIKDGFDGSVSNLIGVRPQIKFCVTNSLFSFTENQFKNGHLWFKLKFIHIKIKRCFHFENIINLGIMGCWINKTWFRIKFSLSSSPNDGYTLGLINLLKSHKRNESIWKKDLRWQRRF